MKIKLFISALAALIITNSAFSQTVNNEMTQAVIQVYNRLLQEDPTDYETYFHRANEYYKHNQYSKALSDIDNAIRYTPENEKDMLLQEYSLRANIYMMTNRKEDALKDITAAFLMNPADYVICYQKANLEYELGHYLEAKEGFKRMQRLNSRSVEALVGLARVSIKENNFGLANDYINKAVEFDQTNSQVYVRRASIRKEMGNNSGCVEDLLIAISLDNNNQKAFRELNEMANTDYRAVIAGISNVISQVPEQGMYYYIRGYIAMDHYHYASALEDFKYIRKENIYNYDGIYRSIAICYLHLGEYASALENIDYAISMTTENGKSYQVKAEILLAMKQYSEALDCVNRAIEKNEESEAVFILKGRAQILLSQYVDASSSFGEASMQNPANAETYLWRGYILSNYLGSQENAKGFYSRMLDAIQDENSVYSLKGFALLMTGREDLADKWIEKILSQNDNDGSNNYYAACYYSLRGDNASALICVEESLKKGFGSIYFWNDYSEGIVNLEKLRNDERYKNLIAKFLAQ